MAGAWDSAYDGATYHSLTKQAWAHREDLGQDDYYNLVDDLNVSESGSYYAGYVYENEKFTLNLWDMYLVDAFNRVFFQLDYNTKLFKYPTKLSAQYSRYDGVGALDLSSDSTYHVGYYVTGLRAQTKFDDVRVRLSYTGVSDDPSMHFFGSFGSYAELADGVLITYFSSSLRDARIYATRTDFKPFKDAKMALQFSYYDLNKEYTKDLSAEGEEYILSYGGKIEYQITKRLSWNFKMGVRRFQHTKHGNIYKSTLRYLF
jgi:hypothetical protein